MQVLLWIGVALIAWCVLSVAAGFVLGPLLKGRFRIRGY